MKASSEHPVTVSGAALIAKNAHFMRSFEARNCSTPKGGAPLVCTGLDNR